MCATVLVVNPIGNVLQRGESEITNYCRKLLISEKEAGGMGGLGDGAPPTRVHTLEYIQCT